MMRVCFLDSENFARKPGVIDGENSSNYFSEFDEFNERNNSFTTNITDCVGGIIKPINGRELPLSFHFLCDNEEDHLPLRISNRFKNYISKIKQHGPIEALIVGGRKLCNESRILFEQIINLFRAEDVQHISYLFGSDNGCPSHFYYESDQDTLSIQPEFSVSRRGEIFDHTNFYEQSSLSELHKPTYITNRQFESTHRQLQTV